MPFEFRHPSTEPLITRTVQRMLGVTLAGFHPDTFGGQSFVRPHSEAHIFLAHTFLAFVLWDESA